MTAVSVSGPESYELARERVFFGDRNRLMMLLPTQDTSPARQLARPERRLGSLEGGPGYRLRI